MSNRQRIYLDNAATSFPKPETVYTAMDDYNRQLGAAVGRGATRSAMSVQSVVDRCRSKAAQLLNAECPERIIFTFNGTDSLNLALHGLLKPGDHVVTSTVEHNSVLRPLRELQQRIGIQVSYVEPDQSGRVEPADIRAAITSKTKLIALIHASNVTGTIQPIADVGEIAASKGVLFLVDAAQSAGHLPIDLGALPIDFLACPGHKGLLGPLGTGLLYVRPGVEQQLQSTRQGGTGSLSEDDRQPETLPDKYESGNHNALGLIGLEAGLTFLSEQGIDQLRKHEAELTEQLLHGLSEITGLQQHGPSSAEQRLGVVSVSSPDYEPQIIAALLDENFGIETRAGLHCAPGIHRALGTFETGGTVRLSLGAFTTPDDITAALTAFRELAGMM
jgi:cysteine desulfurase / selenocysteine lyase